MVHGLHPLVPNDRLAPSHPRRKAPVTSYGFIEIDGDRAPQRLGRLLAAAYAASRHRPTVVWLRNLDAEAADRLLDPVVEELGPRFAGLEFVEADREADAFGLARSAAYRIVSSPALARDLECAGLPWVAVRDGVVFLQGSGATRPASAPAPSAPSRSRAHVRGVAHAS